MHRSLLSSVLSLSILLSALVAAHAVQAATLTVANNGVDSDICGSSAAPCRSISQAIAHANEGDTLMVGPGRYGDLNGNRILGEVGEEPAAFGGRCDLCMIHINKRLTLKSSNGAAVTVIDAGGVEIRAVLIEADGVVFGGRGQGFTIANAGSTGFVVYSSHDVTVVGNIAIHNESIKNLGVRPPLRPPAPPACRGTIA